MVLVRFASLGLSLLLATSALAQSAGDMTLGFGFSHGIPKSDNGRLAVGAVDVGEDGQPTLTFEYFLRDNLGIELIAATPFTHDLSIAGLGRIGTVKQLPPTVTLNYHLPTRGPVKPFFGLGVTHVVFYDEDTSAVLGSDAELGNSWGLSLHAGLDYRLSERGALRTNLRWFDIDSDVSLAGVPLGTAEIDPIVLGLSYVWRF